MNGRINECDLWLSTKHDKCYEPHINHVNAYKEVSNGKWWIFKYFCMSYIERRRMNNLNMDMGHIFYEPTIRNHCNKFN